MLTLLVALIVLAILAWIARAVLVGLGGPAWMQSVLIGLVLLVAVVLVAQAFGVPTPNLR